MAMPKKQDEVKYCASCGKLMSRKVYANGVLESNSEFHRRKYCDRACMVAAFGRKPKKKDPSWATAHYHSRRVCEHTVCEVCGSTKNVDVHHRNEDWRDNRPENLVALCRSCHLKEHRSKKRCVICGGKHKAFGYCDKHYERFKKYGDPMMTAHGYRP